MYTENLKCPKSTISLSKIFLEVLKTCTHIPSSFPIAKPEFASIAKPDATKSPDVNNKEASVQHASIKEKEKMMRRVNF